MSRICDELRKAEREISANQGSAGRQSAPGGERRRGKRRALRVPLFVYGSNVDNVPFLEATDSLGVSENGALLILAAHVSIGQRLMLLNRQNGLEQGCTVVRAGKRGYKMPVGVRFDQPSDEFWEASGQGAAVSPPVKHSSSRR